MRLDYLLLTMTRIEHLIVSSNDLASRLSSVLGKLIRYISITRQSGAPLYFQWMA